MAFDIESPALRSGDCIWPCYLSLSYSPVLREIARCTKGDTNILATTTIPRRASFTVLAITAALITSPGWAADSPSAADIKSAVSGHTYQGSMSSPNSGFAEFYAEDGTIQGKDYTGKWTTKDGAMCFAYGEKPTCYQVTLDHPSMVLREDDEIKGSGMLIEGNAFDQ